MSLFTKKKSIELSAISVFSALAIGGGYALSFVPNVEVMSFLVFSSGFIFGVKVGSLVGLISMTIYTTWNPWGGPIPVISLAQIFGMSLFGAVGGFYGSSYRQRVNFSIVDLLEIGFIAAILTLFYDIETSIAYAYAFGLEKALLWVIIAGTPYMLIHVISNVFIFSFGMKPINRATKQFMLSILDINVRHDQNEESN